MHTWSARAFTPRDTRSDSKEIAIVRERLFPAIYNSARVRKSLMRTRFTQYCAMSAKPKTAMSLAPHSQCTLAHTQTPHIYYSILEIRRTRARALGASVCAIIMCHEWPYAWSYSVMASPSKAWARRRCPTIKHKPATATSWRRRCARLCSYIPLNSYSLSQGALY